MAKICGFPPITVTTFNKLPGYERETSNGCTFLAFQSLFARDLETEACKYCRDRKSHFTNNLLMFMQIALGRPLNIILAQSRAHNHSSLPKTIFSYFYHEFPILVNVASFISIFMTSEELQAIDSASDFFGPFVTSTTRPDKTQNIDLKLSIHCSLFCNTQLNKFA